MENSRSGFAGKRWGTDVRRALAFVAPFKGEVTTVICMSLAVAALGAAEPLVMKYILDRVEALDGRSLAKGVSILVLLCLMREAVGGVSNWLTWKVRLEINYGLLERTVGRLHALPVAYHREETVGGIMTKLDRGINGFVGALSEAAFNVLPGLIYLVVSVAVMFALDWRLSLTVLFFAPLPALAGMWASREQTERERSLLEAWTRIFSRFNEVLTGIMTVKSFAAEEEEKRRFMEGVGRANGMVLRGVATDTGVGAAKNTIAIMARIAAVSLGGYLALRGEITLGTLVAFLGYLSGLFGPVQGLTGVYQTLRRATVSLGIIYSILDADDRLEDSPGAKPVKSVRGQVIFRGVSFAYGGERPLLSSIDLCAEPGMAVAIVGPSGAGKSTMMALLQRLYDPVSGSIEIDGADLRALKQRSLRRQIGLVSQDALLFNDTVRNNIAYGRPGASMREIEEAARAANAHDFISRLPDGYETVTGERGGRLSAGERQRITIARALVKDPPILILDEATSSLDAESEALVQEALERLIKRRTTFIIAHRLSTVVRADRILVLKDGRIIESGSHEELLKLAGYYSALVRTQAKGLLIEAA